MACSQYAMKSSKTYPIGILVMLYYAVLHPYLLQEDLAIKLEIEVMQKGHYWQCLILLLILSFSKCYMFSNYR